MPWIHMKMKSTVKAPKYTSTMEFHFASNIILGNHFPYNLLCCLKSANLRLESLYHRPWEIATHNVGGDQVWSGATHPIKSQRSVQPTGSNWGIGCHQLWHVGVQDQRCHPKTFLWHGMKLGNKSLGTHYTTPSGLKEVPSNIHQFEHETSCSCL